MNQNHIRNDLVQHSYENLLTRLQTIQQTHESRRIPASLCILLLTCQAQGRHELRCALLSVSYLLTCTRTLTANFAFVLRVCRPSKHFVTSRRSLLKSLQTYLRVYAGRAHTSKSLSNCWLEHALPDRALTLFEHHSKIQYTVLT